MNRAGINRLLYIVNRSKLLAKSMEEFYDLYHYHCHCQDIRDFMNKIAWKKQNKGKRRWCYEPYESISNKIYF
jgi:hypothetical protein